MSTQPMIRCAARCGDRVASRLIRSDLRAGREGDTPVNLTKGPGRLSSHAQIGQRMAIPFGIEGSDSLVNSVGEVFAAGERLVCEMMPLQIAPYSLDGIELRGIFWQPFDAEPGRAGGQRGALLVWMGPLSRTSRTGLVVWPGLGP